MSSVILRPSTTAIPRFVNFTQLSLNQKNRVDVAMVAMTPTPTARKVASRGEKNQDNED